MRYVPDGPALAGVPHLRIGPVPPDAPPPAVAFGPEPGASMPSALRAPTATEMALALLRASGESPLAGIEGATSAVFSGDHLLALWALSEPEAALARAGRAEQVARAAAFGVRTSDEVAHIACFLRAYPEEAGISDAEGLYTSLIPRITPLLDRPRDFDLTWIGEYSDVINDDAMLHSGAVQFEDFDDLDLTVMHTPLRLHDLVRMSAVRHHRLLTVRTENTYIVEYRRESWVQYHPGRPLPRIDLRPLAARLALFERNPGRWHADPLDAPTPRLLLDIGDGIAGPSSIAAETVIPEVADYLRAAARRPESHWTPRGANQ